MNEGEEKKWRKMLSERPEANFLQTPEWAKVYEGIRDKPKLISDGERFALGIIKDARRGRYMEVPGGPLLNYGKMGEAKKFFREIVRVAKEENCVFIRFRPQIIDSEKNREKMKELGGRRAPMHLHAENTVIIDLTKTEEELLAAMRRQTRYEVRRAEKVGVEVFEEVTEERVNEFCRMQAKTAERQGFVPVPSNFIRAEFRAFSRGGIRLYRAEYEGKVVAMAMVIISGTEADYIEAASTPAARKIPGAYALQWRIIRDMKALNLARYNMFGISPPESKKHRFDGVTLFKTGFGGERVDYVPAQDIVLKPFRYPISYIIETARRKRRHL